MESENVKLWQLAIRKSVPILTFHGQKCISNCSVSLTQAMPCLELFHTVKWQTIVFCIENVKRRNVHYRNRKCLQYSNLQLRNFTKALYTLEHYSTQSHSFTFCQRARHHLFPVKMHCHRSKELALMDAAVLHFRKWWGDFFFKHNFEVWTVFFSWSEGSRIGYHERIRAYICLLNRGEKQRVL